MAYNKLRWKNRSVQYPARYIETDNGDGTVTHEKAPGEIYEEGTNVSAGNMNNMESGVDTGHIGAALLYTVMGILDQSLTKWVKNVVEVAKATNAAIAAAKKAQTSADAANTSINTVAGLVQQAQRTADDAASAAAAAGTAADAANDNANARAKTNHADAANTYGLGTDGLHGHVKLSDAIDGTSAAAAGGTAATPYAVKLAYDKAVAAQNTANSKAAAAHTSAAATGSVLGHVKLSDATDSTSGAGSSVAATPAAVKAAYDKATAAQTSADGKAPASHASSGTGYGLGNASNYGHLKLYDSPSSSYGVGNGIAATPKAVQAAKDACAPKSHASATNAYGLGISGYYGHVTLSDAINSTTKAADGGVAASPYAVKLAYDKGAEALNKANSHTHKYAGSSAAGGAANSSNLLNVDSSITYGRSGLQYFNASLSTTPSATANYAPTADWWHVIRMNHANSEGYFADLALCLNNDNLQYRRVAAGANSGWVRVYDTKNKPTYSDVGAAPTSHASTATTYGVGTSGNYGHVKLSDAVNSTSKAASSVAASPYAVKLAYDKAAAAASAASAAQTTANNAWSKSALTFTVSGTTLTIKTK